MAEHALETKPKKRASFSSLLNVGMRADREYLMENLTLLVSSGLTVLETLEAIRGDMRSKRMRKLLEHVKESIEDGMSLSLSLEEVHLFPASTISLIRIGEETGNLSKNLNVIRLQQEKDRLFTSKIRGAMLYPVFVLTLTLVIGVGIAWFILPKLATVFASLRMDLPLITKALIVGGVFLGKYGSIVIPGGLCIFFLLLYFIFFFPKTKGIGQAILFLIPGVRRLIQEVELARFSYVLGILLESGFPVTRAIETVAQTTPLLRYRKFYSALAISLDEGNSFRKSFAGYRHIDALVPKPAQQLLAVGEQSGNLAETLLLLGRNYEARTETTTKNLTVILEPVLLVIVWLGVLGVALAVILPIYSLIGGLNSGAPATVTQESSVETVFIPSPMVDGVLSALSEATVEQPLSKLEIHSPDTGLLNVRESATLTGKIVARANTGEVYEYTKEENGWYSIILPGQKSGWVFGQYVTLVAASTK